MRIQYLTSEIRWDSVLVVNVDMSRKFTKYLLQVSVCVLPGLPDQLSTYPSIFQVGKHLELCGQFEENTAT